MAGKRPQTHGKATIHKKAPSELAAGELSADVEAIVGDPGLAPLPKIRGKKTHNLLRTIQQQEKALEMRIAGLSWRETAAASGYNSASAAIDGVNRALTRVIVHNANEFRQLEVARAEALHKAHWGAAINGDARSAEIVLKAMDRRIKLLGLDANQARIANAVETHVAVSAIDKQAIIHAVFSGLTKANLSPSDQENVIQAINIEFRRLGVTRDNNSEESGSNPQVVEDSMIVGGDIVPAP